MGWREQLAYELCRQQTFASARTSGIFAMSLDIIFTPEERTQPEWLSRVLQLCPKQLGNRRVTE